MDSWLVGIVVLAVAVGGTLGGWSIQPRLPGGDQAPGMRETVKLVIGLIGTLSALVLGLMIGTARTSFDRQRQEIIELSSRIISLDRALALYGPETAQLRAEFQALVKAAKARLWPSDRGTAPSDPVLAGEHWHRSLHGLSPSGPDQRFYHARAVELGSALLDGRWLLYQQAAATISVPYVVVIVFWFGVIFAGIGTLAPRTPLVLVMLILCAASVAGAVVLAFDLDRPFDGLLRVSSEPMDKALVQLGR